MLRFSAYNSRVFIRFSFFQICFFFLTHFLIFNFFIHKFYQFIKELDVNFYFYYDCIIISVVVIIMVVFIQGLILWLAVQEITENCIKSVFPSAVYFKCYRPTPKPNSKAGSLKYKLQNCSIEPLISLKKMNKQPSYRITVDLI